MPRKGLTYYAPGPVAHLYGKETGNLNGERERVRQAQMCYMVQRGHYQVRWRRTGDVGDRYGIVVGIFQIRTDDDYDYERSLLRTNA